MAQRPEPVLRALDERDLPALLALLEGSDPWRRLGYVRADWISILTPPHGEREAIVADVGGDAVGLALLRKRFLAGDYLEVLAVAERWRARGLGRALLAEAERRVFARAANLFVCVSDFNQAARRFYDRCGYVEVGALRELLVAGSDEILLRKTRGPARSLPRAG